MRCLCISQVNDSIVRCELGVGHDGLHSWQDPVHPGHSKLWGGNITEVVTSTAHRFESPSKLLERCGVVGTPDSSVYMPMHHPEDEEPLL